MKMGHHRCSHDTIVNISLFKDVVTLGGKQSREDVLQLLYRVRSVSVQCGENSPNLGAVLFLHIPPDCQPRCSSSSIGTLSPFICSIQSHLFLNAMSRPQGAGSAANVSPCRLRQIALVAKDLKKAEEQLVCCQGLYSSSQTVRLT